MYKILVVGAGNLGSRYIEGLKKVSFPLSITVIDTSIDSLKNARELWSKSKSISTHKIEWLLKLESIPKHIDIAIISTTANFRLDVIVRISKTSKVRYWIVEKVLAQSQQQLTDMGKCFESADGVWVNKARRTMKWHDRLKKEMILKSPITVKRFGSNWGLACNTIHFIDLVTWWTGETIQSVDTSNLHKLWHQSKRNGFYEIYGMLEAKFSSGSILKVKADLNEKDKGIEINNNGAIWKIDESIGLAKTPDNKIIKGVFEYQSSLTKDLVYNILNSGTCALTSFEESSEMHKIFIDALLLHWNTVNKCNDSILPIT